MVAETPNPVLRPGSFIGKVGKQVDLADFCIKELANEGEVTPHTHEAANFLLVLEGRYITSAKNVDGMCSAGTLIFDPPGTTHHDRCQTADGRLLAVSLKRSAGKRLAETVGLADRSIGFARGVIPWLGARLHDELQVADRATPLILEGLVLEILGHIGRRRTRGGGAPSWLQRVEELLSDRFADALSIKDIAQSAGVHPAHLVATFRKHHHVTLGEYVRRLRIEFARRQLIETSASLSEIATSAGFYDQSHFSKTFKQQIGTTPSQFRAAART